MKIGNQLEMPFEKQTVSRPHFRRETRMERARWWFRRMHEVVNEAVAWPPAHEPRPEQTYLRMEPRPFDKAA